MKQITFLLAFFAILMGCESEITSLNENHDVLFTLTGPPVSGSSEDNTANSGDGGGGNEGADIPGLYRVENSCGDNAIQDVNFISLKNTSEQTVYVNIIDIETQSEYTVIDWSHSTPGEVHAGFVELMPGEQINILLHLANRPDLGQNSGPHFADFSVTYSYKYTRLVTRKMGLFQDSFVAEDFGVCGVYAS